MKKGNFLNIERKLFSKEK